MGPSRYLLRVLNIISILFYILTVVYNLSFNGNTLFEAMFSSPANIISVLTWTVTLYIWIREQFDERITKTIGSISPFFTLMMPVIAVISIALGITMNIIIMFDYGLLMNSEKDSCNSLGYFWILLIDIAVVLVIAIIDFFSNYKAPSEYTISETGLNYDIVFLGTVFALLSSYAIMVIIDTFVWTAKDQPSSIAEWLFDGLLSFVFVLIGEAINIIVNILKSIMF